MRMVLEKVNHLNWTFEVSRKFCWFIEWGQIQANTKSNQIKYTGLSITSDNFMILNGDEYYLEDDLQSFYNFFDNKFNEDQSFFEKFAKKIFDITENVENFRYYLEQINFKELSNQELLKHLNQFSEMYVKSMIPAWVRPDMYLEERLSKELPKNAIGKVTIPADLGELAYRDEPLKLMLTAQKIKEGKKIDKDIEFHVRNYAWQKGPITTEDVSFTKNDYLERIKLYLLKTNLDYEINRIRSERTKAEKEYKESIQKYTIHGKLLKLVEALRTFIFLRTLTTESNEHLFQATKVALFKEIAKRAGLPFSVILSLEPDEIASCLDNKVSKQNLVHLVKERQKGFAIIWIQGKLAKRFGDEAVNLQNLVSKKYKKQKKAGSKDATNQIKGICASRGTAKGKVKVVFSNKDIPKVNKGDILVSSMINPDFVIAMEKAAAFVTDEGGITCHAAIVAREFGVPCIVGTVNATAILRDGDLVEVHADKGTIKILRNT